MIEDQSTLSTLQRLVALLKAGYVVDACNSHPSFISLEHPSPFPRVREKSLMLHEHGDVFGGGQLPDETPLIPALDHPAFRRFIASTPKPTWWELNGGPFYTVLGFFLIAALLFGGVKVFDYVIAQLRPLWA